MQIMLVFEIQIFVHQIQPVDFWFNISYSVRIINLKITAIHQCGAGQGEAELRILISTAR